jgi:hypothetical protein
VLPAILLDQGLPWQVAEALRALDLPANAIGDGIAPPEGSSDETNIQWCAQNDVVLITNDLGSKDKTIYRHLTTHHVHAVFIFKDLRAAEPYELARALLNSAQRLGEMTATGKGLVHHRLRRGGGLEKR